MKGMKTFRSLQNTLYFNDIKMLCNFGGNRHVGYEGIFGKLFISHFSLSRKEFYTIQPTYPSYYNNISNLQNQGLHVFSVWAGRRKEAIDQ
ncbi:MAG: hypothetical protein A4E65_03617 [Syntrophorhabdus sp. PtaU1.Bin153]|nr:MAG: hypothetical protein A4E65_03617 [Syntrophorhabdus sp. PtaU1.Bin153]